MKKLMGVVIGLAMLVPGTCLAQSLTAQQILAKVSQTYRGLTSFRFVQRGKDTASPTFVGPPGGPTQPFDDGLPSHGLPVYSETDLAVSSPGKFRVVVSSGRGKVVVASNGRKTWVYIPDLNEYIETAAAPLLQELWADNTYPTSFASGAITHYRNLSRVAKHARLRGEETLSLKGRKVRCYVLEVSGDAWGRLWVDEQRFVVLQDEWSDWYDHGGYFNRRLTEADLGPIPSRAFEFKAPGGARRVDMFSAPAGTLQRTEEEFAIRLVGWEKWSNGGKGVLYPFEGTEAHDFTLANLGGGNVRLRNLRGKIVVLDFFASWCKPCQEELADIQKLHEGLASKSVVFLAIDDENPQTAKSFITAHGYTFPVLIDPKDTTHQLYGVRLVPTTVVINRKGKIAAHFIGAGGKAQLLSALKKAGLKLPTKSARK